MSEKRLTDEDYMREELRTGDHDAEVAALREQLRTITNRYWFVGLTELVGALHREAFERMAMAREST